MPVSNDNLHFHSHMRHWQYHMAPTYLVKAGSDQLTK